MKPRTVETVRRAAQRINICNLKVESAMFAKKTERNRSVLHGLAYIQGAVLYMRTLRGLVLPDYEVGVGSKA